MGDPLNHLQDVMVWEVVCCDDKAISAALRTTAVREVTYIEPAVKGDTSGKLLRPAKITTWFNIPLPPFVEIGGQMGGDTGTGEYKSRSN